MDREAPNWALSRDDSEVAAAVTLAAAGAAAVLDQPPCASYGIQLWIHNSTRGGHPTSYTRNEFKVDSL